MLKRLVLFMLGLFVMVICNIDLFIDELFVCMLFLCFVVIGGICEYEVLVGCLVVFFLLV